MFGTLGGPEVILILVVALIVFGPRRLPEIGKTMGKMLAEFRKASNDFKRTIDDELEAEKAREAQAATVRPPEAAAAPAVVHMITPPESEPAITAETPDAPTAASAVDADTLGGRGEASRGAETINPLGDTVSAERDPSGGSSDASTGAAPDLAPNLEPPAEPAGSRDRSADEK